jgi:hypothetical protein
MEDLVTLYTAALPMSDSGQIIGHWFGSIHLSLICYVRDSKSVGRVLFTYMKNYFKRNTETNFQIPMLDFVVYLSYNTTKFKLIEDRR